MLVIPKISNLLNEPFEISVKKIEEMKEQDKEFFLKTVKGLISENYCLVLDSKNVIVTDSKKSHFPYDNVRLTIHLIKDVHIVHNQKSRYMLHVCVPDVYLDLITPSVYM